MQSVRSAAVALPTDLAGLPRLLAYTQAVGLEQFLFRPTRGIPSLVLALVWLVLAWRGTGRPHHVAELQEPLLAAYRAELPRRAERVWVSLDSHQLAVLGPWAA
jgi:hypothetical protein